MHDLLSDETMDSWKMWQMEKSVKNTERAEQYKEVNNDIKAEI